jgi:hypothetical protein
MALFPAVFQRLGIVEEGADLAMQGAPCLALRARR